MTECEFDDIDFENEGYDSFEAWLEDMEREMEDLMSADKQRDKQLGRR